MSTKAVDTFSRRLPHAESALLMQLGGADSRPRPPNGRCPVRPSRCSGQAQTRNPGQRTRPSGSSWPGYQSSRSSLTLLAPADRRVATPVGALRWAAGLINSLTLRPVLAPQQMGSRTGATVDPAAAAEFRVMGNTLAT